MAKSPCWTIVVLLIGVLACETGGRPPIRPPGNAPALIRRPPDPPAEPERSALRPCPSPEFEAFLAAYAEDPALQRQWTRFPLEKLVLVDDGKEPAEVVRSIPDTGLDLPLLPPASQRASDSLELRIEAVAHDRRRVVIEKPDTDWKIHYLFELDGCWRLIRMEDRSL